MLENYLAYLSFLEDEFKKFFEQQKPYIFCKKGCGKCCKNAQFPYSNIEVLYLLMGAQKLDDNTLQEVMENIKTLKQEKANFKGKKFRYDCPFLVNNECCVYDYRGIVCRAFGLLTVKADGKVEAPFCYAEGLNYSNVVEDGGKNVSPEKFKLLGVKEKPFAYNVSYKTLTDPEFERAFKFNFGEKKPLIDWF